MCVNSYEYACLIDQFWFEYGYMYHHLEFKYLNPFFVHSIHAHLSRMHAPSGSHHSLFSSSPARSLHVSPILANMVSRHREVSLSLSLYITRFSLSLTSLSFSGITRYLCFLFTATHALSLVFHFVFLSRVLSRTPYLSRYDSYH